MIEVGLTGCAASGKSTVARIWASEGVPVLSADDLAREVVEPGSLGLREVVEAFGDDVLAVDGTLDRKAVRDRVFHDEAQRRRLEEILHPRIADRRDQWLRDRRAEGRPLVVVEVPLLFEVGLEGEFDVVVTVHASREECLRRLTGDRGLEPDVARRILDAQMDPEEKRARADVVVDNQGTLEDLRAAALKTLSELRELPGTDRGPGRSAST